MNPDYLFLAGVALLLLVFPAAVSAFSSSGKSFRPAILCFLGGGALVAVAMSQSPGTYSVNDVPRIVRDIVR